MEVCKRYAGFRAWKVLLEFQVFLRDFIRAGLTGIEMYAGASTPNEKLVCLGVMKENFTRASDQSDAIFEQNTTSIKSRLDLLRYLKAVSFQTKLIKFFQGLKTPEKEVEQYHLFGKSDTKKEAIVVCLYEHQNFDLAYQIMQEYRLSNNVYREAAVKLAKRKLHKKVDELLKMAKPFLPEADFDQYVFECIQGRLHDNTNNETHDSFCGLGRVFDGGILQEQTQIRVVAS